MNLRNKFAGKVEGLLDTNLVDPNGQGMFKNRQVSEKNISVIKSEIAMRSGTPKKILLVNSRIDTARFLPLGIASLAAYLIEQGHEVGIWEALPTQTMTLAERVKQFDPDVVGISAMTSQFAKGLELAQEVKSSRSNVPIIFGGVHATSTPRETLLQNSDIDYVCMGEGEYTFTEFLDHLEDKSFEEIAGLGYQLGNQKDGSGVFVNSTRGVIHDLDSLPLPARHLFDMDFYRQRWNWPRGMWLSTGNMMSSRGCPFDCTYCASKVMFGRGFKPRSVENTMFEVRELIETYGFDCISFSDDTFAIQKHRAKEIGREFQKLDTKAKFRVQLRVDTCEDDLIEELVKGGLVHVDFGIESGAEKILKDIKKGYKRDQIFPAVEIVKKHGVSVGATFIIGTIGETLEDIQETRSVAKKVGADYTQFFIMTPYPGTELWDYAREKGLIFENLTYEHFRHGGEQLQPFMKVELTSDGLIRMQDDLNNEFVNKTVRKFLLQPTFIKDFLSSGKVGTFVTTFAKSGNLGRSLKTAMPHNL